MLLMLDLLNVSMDKIDMNIYEINISFNTELVSIYLP